MRWKLFEADGINPVPFCALLSLRGLEVKHIWVMQVGIISSMGDLTVREVLAAMQPLSKRDRQQLNASRQYRIYYYHLSTNQVSLIRSQTLGRVRKLLSSGTLPEPAKMAP